jgi:magnesium chelatase subunit D
MIDAAPSDEDSPPGERLWADAILAARLLAVDPAGLGGAALRAAAGPVRDRWIEAVRAGLPPQTPFRRIPVSIEDDRLLGGLDLASSLALGRPVAQRGLLAESDGGVVVAASAERMGEATAARIGAALDRGEVRVARDGMDLLYPARIAVIALDEGASFDERPPLALLERLAFSFDLNAVSVREAQAPSCDPAEIAAARACLAQLPPVDEAVVSALCEAAAAFGVGSGRAQVLALRAAMASAALSGRRQVTTDDAIVAARLVLVPRALHAPPDPQTETPPEPPEPEEESQQETPESSSDEEQVIDPDAVADMVIEAIKAALPDDVLARLAQAVTGLGVRPSGRGAGAPSPSLRRGRPIGSRAGQLRAGARLDLVATLRAAAPWQTLRRGERDAPADAVAGRIEVRREDFRIRRFVQKAESTTIFVVDASGSAAFQRLAEAKGAVESLLAGVYVTRARVSLVAFRKTAAEVLLPPTRSLARAKRCLADLPGGGGTPLAAGIDAAYALALDEKTKGRTPLIVFLTDSRANIGRDGAPGREKAQQDAAASARMMRQSALSTMVVDTSNRPGPEGERLAREMGAVFTPLPFANPGALAEKVRAYEAAQR